MDAMLLTLIIIAGAAVVISFAYGRALKKINELEEENWGLREDLKRGFIQLREAKKNDHRGPDGKFIKAPKPLTKGKR